MSIVGLVIVLVCVFGGFIISGGNMGAFNHPSEYIIIIGAALGSMLVANPMSVIKHLIHGILGTMKNSPYTKAYYLRILKMLFDLFQIGRREGSTALEAHIENPKESAVFSQYPEFLANHHASDFICDTLKIVTGSSISPYDLEDMMDMDIKTAHAEEHKAPAALSVVGDAFPGIGIVAAVCGIIITMSSIAEGPEVVGEKVAGALVGTFLGVLLAYGISHPIAAKINSNLDSEGRMFMVLKIAILSFAKGAPPAVAVEFARRAIYPTDRPGFKEVEEACRAAKG